MIFRMKKDSGNYGGDREETGKLEGRVDERREYWREEKRRQRKPGVTFIINQRRRKNTGETDNEELKGQVNPSNDCGLSAGDVELEVKSAAATQLLSFSTTPK